MTDDQLFWAGLVAAHVGLAVALGALFWPHVRWWLHDRQARRRHAKRMGLIRAYLP